MLSYLTNLSVVPLATNENKQEFYRNRQKVDNGLLASWVLGSNKHCKKGNKTTNPGVGEDKKKSEGERDKEKLRVREWELANHINCAWQGQLKD